MSDSKCYFCNRDIQRGIIQPCKDCKVCQDHLLEVYIIDNLPVRKVKKCLACGCRIKRSKTKQLWTFCISYFSSEYPLESYYIY